MPILRVLAICPNCTASIPRKFFFRGKRCPSCNANIRPRKLWDFLTTVPFVIMQFGSLAAWKAGMVSWVFIPISVFVFFLIGPILFPYVTPYVNADDDSIRNDETPEKSVDLSNRDGG